VNARLDVDSPVTGQSFTFRDRTEVAFSQRRRGNERIAKRKVGGAAGRFFDCKSNVVHGRTSGRESEGAAPRRQQGNNLSFFVQPRLINDPFSDPGLFIDFRFARRALLFDLGDVGVLSARELLRVSHAFVSHTHMDHFAGFDRLLRVCLNRTAPLHLVGPPDFTERVEHKLGAYTWNLVGDESADFVITAAEFAGEGLERKCLFRAREAFRRRDVPSGQGASGIVLDEAEFQVASAVLDHGTPCLAFAFEEKLRVNVWKEGLDRLALPVGPWLNEAKRAVRSGAPDATRIGVSGGRSVALGDLTTHALKVAPGQKIAYITDAAYHESNAARIMELARDADQVFIEACFLDVDAEIAAQSRHLTARQAGVIARRAGAACLIPFHFSARYLRRADDLRRKAEDAFRG
jgi:ribonuclease Z